jgi:hypothetical protein
MRLLDRWRQEFGGLNIEQLKRLKELELENAERGNHRGPHVYERHSYRWRGRDWD